MKRIDRLSGREIRELYIKTGGLCNECLVKELCESIPKGEYTTCIDVVNRYLDEEPDAKPRYEIYKTPKEAFDAFCIFCGKSPLCAMCEFHDGESKSLCRFRWLYGKEEVKNEKA